MAAVKRYDEISRIGRRSLTAAPGEYDWEMMLATGRNNYGNPEQCIREYSQRDEALLFRYAHHHFQFRRLSRTPRS